jgi:hypothetical protein
MHACGVVTIHVIVRGEGLTLELCVVVAVDEQDGAVVGERHYREAIPAQILRDANRPTISCQKGQ